MSIEMTRSVQRVETYPAQQPSEAEPNPKPTLMAVYNLVFDDPDDPTDFPTSSSTTTFLKHGDSLEGQDELVVTIANTVWGE